MRHVHRQRFGVIPNNGASLHRFQQPFRNQPFRKLALRIFVVKE